MGLHSEFFRSPISRRRNALRRHDRSRFMNWLFRHLRPLMPLVHHRAGMVLLGAIAVTLMALTLVVRLRIDADLTGLLPPEHPTVLALEQLRSTVGSEADATVVIRSPSFAANKAFAEALIPLVLDLRPEQGPAFFQRVDYRRDTRVLQDNGLYFATTEELDRLELLLLQRLEEARLRGSPLYVPLDDAEPADSTLTHLQQLFGHLMPGEYPVSADSTIMALRFYPSMAQTDLHTIEAAYGALQRVVDELDPQHFDPRMEVILAGRLLRQLIEVQALTGDVYRSFAAGVSAVLLVVIVYFTYKAGTLRAHKRLDPAQWRTALQQAPLMGLLIGLPFLMSLAVTFGLTFLLVGSLNLLTSTLGLVLFGLGIDYGIHFYARYTEERGRGHTVLQALEITFTSTGQAIAVSACTTAGALYVLMAAGLRGFSQFGFVAGTGILLALVAMVVIMPALIVLVERRGWLGRVHIALPSRPTSRNRALPGCGWIAVAGTAALVLALVLLPRLSFEYDFSGLEPDYAEYRARRALVQQVYPPLDGRNPAYVLVDEPAEVDDLLNQIHTRARSPSSTIGTVVALQDRFPMDPAAQHVKLQRIARIRELLDHPLAHELDHDDLSRLRRAAGTVEPLRVEQLPAFLQHPFITRDGRIGGFIRVYPNVDLVDSRNAIDFLHDIGHITTSTGRTYYAASTALVGGAMVRMMIDEAPWMVLYTLGMVAVLMWLNFGSVRWSVLALLPLFTGVLWMLLAMELLGLKLNFFNVIVLPAVLGIGNDAGAHLVHRYREEGRGSLRTVMRSTGEHITMGSLTTVIGFGGLLLSFHPGLRSIGLLATIGIGSTWLAAVLFLPALLQLLESYPRVRDPGSSAHRIRTAPRSPVR